MDRQSLEQWAATQETAWLMKFLKAVQAQSMEDCLRSASKEPFNTVGIVARAEGRYDLVEAIKAMIHQGDEV